MVTTINIPAVLDQKDVRVVVDKKILKEVYFLLISTKETEWGGGR